MLILPVKDWQSLQPESDLLQSRTNVSEEKKISLRKSGFANGVVSRGFAGSWVSCIDTIEMILNKWKVVAVTNSNSNDSNPGAAQPGFIQNQ